MISTPLALCLAAAALAVAVAVAVYVWRKTRPRPALGPIIVEQGPTRIELAPWSPTRGHYWFDSSSFPPAYRALPEAAHGLVKVQGDSEEAALAELNSWLGAALLKITRRQAEPITSKAVRFKPLNRRKGQ